MEFSPKQYPNDDLDYGSEETVKQLYELELISVHKLIKELNKLSGGVYLMIPNDQKVMQLTHLN